MEYSNNTPISLEKMNYFINEISDIISIAHYQ